MKKHIILLITLLTFSACQDSEKLLLHVPSPDWEDQVIYFIMTDRFFLMATQRTMNWARANMTSQKIPILMVVT